MVNEISAASNQRLENQLTELTSLVRQLAIGQHQPAMAAKSAGSSNLPSQTIPNLRGNASAVTLRIQQDKTVPVSFPTRTISARKPESDEELLKMFRKVEMLKMFRKVEINIPLLDTIKQIPKYAKYLKELCVHKRKKMKGSTKIGGVVSALMRNENFTEGAQALPKKCRDPEIFSIPCTIGSCTFAYAMLDLGASINVMSASIYRALNVGDLETTGMTI
ncbi:hypothetical protein CR513_54623, partial [Mucuna pruriens]